MPEVEETKSVLPSPRILIVKNYGPDNSFSMLSFADVLEQELSRQGVSVRTIFPKPVAIKLLPFGWWSKWLGYVDKLIVFPFVCMMEAKKADLIHICDHSNSLYALFLCRNAKVLVTCHDLLAVRAAMGEAVDCATSLTGRILQQLILRGLKRCDSIVCVSRATYRDALRILGNAFQKRMGVLSNCLNHDFKRLERMERMPVLVKNGLEKFDQRYILAVGKPHQRKNWAGVIKTFAFLKHDSDFQLVFAGHPLSDNLRSLVASLGLEERVVEVAYPTIPEIQALYSAAFALLMPSSFEGFGLPLIEAQSCGCPVVCSDIEPFAEIMQDSAMMAGKDEHSLLAQCILSLRQEEVRKERIEAGYKNVEKFSAQHMAKSYVRLYNRLLSGKDSMICGKGSL